MTQPTRRLFYGWWIVGASFLVLLVTVGIGLYAPPVFLVPLQEHFGWSRAAIAGGSALAALTVGFMGPLVGLWIDRYGSRRVMTIGALVMGSGFALISTIRSLWQLYALNMFVASGIACVAWIPNQTLISNWFTRKRGTAMGITLAGIGFGGLIMSPLASLLEEELGWRAAFAVLGSLILLIVVGVTLAVVRSQPAELGLLPDGEPAESGGRAADSLDAGGDLAKLPGLSLSESLKTRAFWLLSIGHVLWTFGSMSLVGHIPAFLTDEGFDEKVAATLSGFAIGVSIAGRLSFGVLADRLSKSTIMSLAMILHVLALLGLFRVDSFGALPAYVILFGMGLGGGAVLVPLLVGECFGLRAFGKVLGLVMISATLGAAAGPVLTGRIFDVTGSYTLAFVLHGIAFAMAALVFYCVRRPGAAAAVPS